MEHVGRGSLYMGMWLTLHEVWGSEDICFQAVVFLIEIKDQTDSSRAIVYYEIKIVYNAFLT